MILNVNIIGASFRDMLLESDEEAIKTETARAQQSASEITAALKELAGMVDTDRSKQLLADVQQSRDKAAADERQFLGLMSAGKWEDATSFLLGSERKSQSASLETLQTFVNYNCGRMALASGEAADSYDSGRTLLATLAVVATLGGCPSPGGSRAPSPFRCASRSTSPRKSPPRRRSSSSSPMQSARSRPDPSSWRRPARRWTRSSPRSNG